MIRNISFFLVVLAIIALPIIRADHDKVIPFDQLPLKVRVMLQKHLDSKIPMVVTMDWDDYKVKYPSGEKFEFDKDGNWRDLDFWLSQVPAELVPEQIQASVDANFPGTSIVKIERDFDGYDVKLNNGFDLEYNRQFQIIDIDDDVDYDLD